MANSADKTQLSPLSASGASPLNQSATTSKKEMLGANSANKTVAAKTVSPASKIGKILLGTSVVEDDAGVTADWYRNGKPSSNPKKPDQLDLLPRMVDPRSEEPAVIKVFGYDKKKKKEVELVPGYTKLFLESVQEGHQERSQIVETFGDFYVFMYGERPPMYSFSGTLINTKNYNWVADFQYYYENFLRGTKCVDQNAHIEMLYAGRYIKGYMLEMNTSTSAVNDLGVGVRFSIVVTERRMINTSEDFGYSMVGGKMVKSDAFKAFLDKVAGPSGAGSSKPAVSDAIGAAKSVLNGAPASSLASKYSNIA